MKKNLKKIIGKYQKINQKELYHYTSIKTLESIIKKNEIWLTNVLYLNDKMEFLDYLKNASETFNDFVFPNDSTGEMIKKLYQNDVKTFAKNPNELCAYYMFSTCMEKNYIPMWNYYSGQTGLSIELSKLELDDAFSSVCNEKLSYDSYICLYDDDTKQDIVKEFIDTVETNKQIERNELVEIAKFRNALLQYSWAFKNKSFKYEKEFRYVFQVANSLEQEKSGTKTSFDLDYTFTDEIIKPIIKLKFKNKLPIKKVYVSPLNKDERVIFGLRRFLNSRNYDNVEIEQLDNGLR